MEMPTDTKTYLVYRINQEAKATLEIAPEAILFHVPGKRLLIETRDQAEATRVAEECVLREGEEILAVSVD